MQWFVTVGACLGLILSAAACASAPPSPASPPTSAKVLQNILGDCWGVAALKDLDGTRAEHTGAFECARTRLLQMARAYPDAAEPHRLLAWGYYFALKDEDAARAEYERAAEIYAAQGRTSEQAEMLVQLASLALKYDRSRGCDLLQEAVTTDPKNARAAQLIHNFACVSATVPPATPPPAPTPTVITG